MKLSRTGLITSYLNLRLVVRSGFLDIYPARVFVAEKGFASVAVGPYSVTLCDYP